MQRLLLAILTTALLSAQPPGGRGGPPTPGRGAEATRWEDWSAMRSAASAILGWKVGISAAGFPQLTFAETLAKADSLGVAFIEASNAQKVSAEIPKKLDQHLAPGEINLVKDRLNAFNIRMPVYHLTAIDADPKLFEFAKGLGVETIAADRQPESWPAIDKLAQQYGVTVAICAKDGCTDRQGRILVATGVRADPDFKPTMITVEPAGFAAFEKAIQPAMARRVTEISKTAAIRGPDRLTPEERSAIDAALPAQAPAKPKKARKLLVLDLNIAYPGHRSIPAENYGLETMGKKTGAYEAVFSNDLDNLKYDKIRQFDAVFLNNTVGQIFVDPEVRDGLVRFVREGGGLAGNHGVSHAAMDWPEFSEMIGVRRGVHREPTEQATIHIEDPSSPLTAAFDGKEFVYQDEFFRFPNPPYSREKLHVLLRMDVAKTDMYQGRACASPCVRPDYDYAVSWIRSYGKGRVFFCILGHNPTIFTTPPVAKFFLAGIQFILGDLDADTTPSAKLPAKGK